MGLEEASLRRFAGRAPVRRAAGNILDRAQDRGAHRGPEPVVPPHPHQDRPEDGTPTPREPESRRTRQAGGAGHFARRHARPPGSSRFSRPATARVPPVTGFPDPSADHLLSTRFMAATHRSVPPARRTHDAPGRRTLRYESFDEVMPDVERLLDGHTTVGNWTLAQICHHLAAVLRRHVDLPASTRSIRPTGSPRSRSGGCWIGHPARGDRRPARRPARKDARRARGDGGPAGRHRLLPGLAGPGHPAPDPRPADQGGMGPVRTASTSPTI